MVKSYRYRESPHVWMPRKMGCHKGYIAKHRVHQPLDIAARSVLNDDAHVAQTAALVVGNNNVALCPFARLLQA